MMWQWRARIADEDVPLNQYSKLARDWRTCGIGEARKRNPELRILWPNGPDENYPPKDWQLEAYGMSFWRAVKAGDRLNAGMWLSKIQRRVRTLNGLLNPRED